jgi:hypothetical protein
MELYFLLLLDRSSEADGAVLASCSCWIGAARWGREEATERSAVMGTAMELAAEELGEKVPEPIKRTRRRWPMTDRWGGVRQVWWEESREPVIIYY